MVIRIFMATILVAVVGIGQTAPAQTSDIDERSMEIIEACIVAMGTEMQLRSIDTLSLRGTTRVVQHEETGEEILIVVSGGDKFHMSQGDGEAFTTFSGDQGWTGVPGQPPQRLDAGDVGLVREFLPLPHVVAGWNYFSGTVRFAGAGEVDGRPVWKLGFTEESGSPKFTRYFDQESKLLVRQEFDRVVQEFDYIRVNEVEIISKMEILDGPGSAPGEVYQTFEFDEIKINDPVPDDLFQMPDEQRDNAARQEPDQADK